MQQRKRQENDTEGTGMTALARLSTAFAKASDKRKQESTVVLPSEASDHDTTIIADEVGIVHFPTCIILIRLTTTISDWTLFRIIT